MDKDTIKLIEKIARAKEALKNSRVSHRHGCASEDLTGYPVPCNCGASDKNNRIDKALRELDLDDL
jgi:hypothetical protein